ncbi:MAG TPA: alpha-glucuronidase [Cellulomonas sp.]
MAGQPPLSPWMGPDYTEPCRRTPVRPDGERDRAWLARARATWRDRASDDPTPGVVWSEQPDAPIRMLDHWDNLDGSVERGYAGRSLFFEEGRFREDWDLLERYAELLGSIRINLVCLNNVNVRDEARWLITDELGHLGPLRRVADIFGAHGIRIAVAVNFAAPRVVGGLGTSDPLDPQVQEFWAERVAELYRRVPDFGGFVVKADAEGEPGPLRYGRTHGDGANMLARLVAPHGGLVFWRAFVYDHEQDWRDRRTDRAKAAYESFVPLDGTFDDNVVLQVKNGPIDFQVREPVSPLLGALRRTNQACELQITQEYLGQQQHVCFLAPLWREVLEHRPDAPADDPGAAGSPTLLGTLRRSSPTGRYGLVAVANTGTDASWTGHPLAQANLYAFGRLAWDATLTPEQIAREWVELTYPAATPRARQAVVDLLVTSRDTYRMYTVPLGIGFMCRPGHHYGVDVDGYEYDRWGTYHFADRDGIGVDRTLATGSGFTGQYRPGVRDRYEDLATCPDEDLLFFHHVPYTHVLRSGSTVVQHVYDSHAEGCRRAEEYLRTWDGLAGEIDVVHAEVHERLVEQVAQARQWRDVVTTYFLRHSGIADQRAGEPGRTTYR